MTDKRKISDGVRHWLSGEITSWVAEGIISRDQSERILSRYESASEIADRKHSAATFVLMGLAGLMVGLAALLLVGYNWSDMPAGVKLGILFGSLLAAHGLGFWLRFGMDARRSSELAFFLGCLLFGVGIWQVAQIFHIQSHYPNGIWIWALGTLVIALCLDTPLLHALFVALMAIWAGMEILNFPDLGSWLFGRWHGIPNGGYSLPLLVLPGLLWSYRKQSVMTVGLYVPLLAWWVAIQPFAWHCSEGIVYFIGATGGLFLLMAQLHPDHSRFGIVFRFYGALLAAGALIPLSFHDFNREISHSHMVPVLAELSMGMAILVLSFGVIIAAILVRRVYSHDSAPLPDQMLSVLRRQWLPLGLILAMAILPVTNEMLFPGLLPTVAANVAMVMLAIWLMQIGLREDRGVPFAAGVVYFLLWTIFRYIDLFADFGGMLGAAMMFFLCGAGLFGMSLYWRYRRGRKHV
jgi:uncharacterized membrane protein